jgi:hypothetical protein
LPRSSSSPLPREKYAWRRAPACTVSSIASTFDGGCGNVSFRTTVFSPPPGTTNEYSASALHAGAASDPRTQRPARTNRVTSCSVKFFILTVTRTLRCPPLRVTAACSVSTRSPSRS